MNASWELDALVAEKVMGLSRQVRIKGSTEYVTIYSKNPYFPDGSCDLNDLNFYAAPKNYSTSIAPAWEVVEKLDDCLHLREHGEEGIWEAWFCGLGEPENENRVAHADTAPLAICLAALKAVGVEVA